MTKLLRELRYQLGRALPFWLLQLLSNWWPDNRFSVRLRGALLRPWLGRCGRNLQIGRDVTLLAMDRLTIGDDVYLAKGAWINAIGGVTIEDQVITGPYVVIASSTHGFRDGSARFGGAHPAPVRIGRGTWLAAHVVVAAGTSIGSGNLVGANAVVTRNTPDHVVVGGVPARVLRPRDDNPSDIRSKQDRVPAAPA